MTFTAPPYLTDPDPAPTPRTVAWRQIRVGAPPLLHWADEDGTGGHHTAGADCDCGPKESK